MNARRQIDFENELNDEQRNAVLNGDGPCLVLAGAGSGKTRAITYRVAYLINKGVSPRNILLLTFTNKASAEMISRVEELCGSNTAGLWAGTFHSVANRLLRLYASSLGYTKSFVILDADDSESLIKSCVKDLQIDTKTSRFASAKVLASILSYARNAQCSVRDSLEKKYPGLEHILESVELVAEHYEKKKRDGNMMDFDDLLLLFLRLLDENGGIADALSRQFEYILVDEFQDTNTVQASIVRRLASAHRNIFVVGDDAQSIYSFRAADIKNILKFNEWFPDAKIFKMTTNYRSAPEILSLANASISNNVDQYRKDLKTSLPNSHKPLLISSQTSRHEAQYIADQILKLKNSDAVLSDIAVLFRSSFHSQQLELELARRNIPYEYRGGMRFFERAHIKDVVSYLRATLNTKDESAWMRVLGHQPGVGIVTAAVIFNFVKGFESISDVLNLNDSCPARGREGFNGFSRLIKNAVNENLPAEMIRKISKSDYREYLEHTYPDFMERLEDIEQFALFAEQYGALTDFLAEVTLNDDYGVGMRDGARDKIILSTIHQAKGLEWETVFVMRLQEGSFPHKKSLEELTALEEERRLFYVAVTRAKRRLFLTYPICAGMTGFEFGEPSSFIQEVPRSLFDEAHCGQPSANRDYLDGVFDDDEPVIVLNHIGETKKQNRKSPTSFLRDV